jgi:phytoene dehydrogenase-like protein
MFQTKLFSMPSKLRLARMFLRLRSEKPERCGDMTWREWVERHTGDPALQRFLRAFGTVNSYTRPSGDLSAKFMLAHIQRVVFARDYVGYMFGGWRVMYDAFIDDLTANRGTLATGVRIERLETAPDGRIVAAITDDGERYDADVFVSTLPPQDAPAIAVEGSPLRSELSQWSALEDVRALCMDLGFSRVVRDDLTFVFDVERDLYFSMHSATATDLAPAGSQMLHAMAYLSPEEASDERLLAQRNAELVDGLDRHFTGWRDALAVERTLPNVRVAVARNTPAQFGRNRVPMRASSAANLYFAGDGRDLGYNLTDICFASAMEVADAVGALPASTAAPQSVAP